MAFGIQHIFLWSIAVIGISADMEQIQQLNRVLQSIKNTVVPNAPAFSGIRWGSSHISF